MRKVFIISILLLFLAIPGFSQPPTGDCDPDDESCNDGDDAPLDSGVIILVGITIAYVIITFRKNLNSTTP